MVAIVVKDTTTLRVLHFLIKHGPSGCSDIGTVIDNRHGRISSVNGGGDYAAQMLLGRMRKAGLVHVMRDDGDGYYQGSSKWNITPKGRKVASE